MIVLPEKSTKPAVAEARRLFIYSLPKTGKTSNLTQLPNCLIIDMEDSGEFYEGMSFNVKRTAIENGWTIGKTLMELSTSLKERAKSGKKYDFIVIDTTSALEDTARERATVLYKRSKIGQNFDGKDVVAELSNGAGYDWLRKAFTEFYDMFQGVAAKCLILSGHVKLSSISKKGKDISARDIQLTGKLKQMITSDVDGIGYLFRDTEAGKNILSFKREDSDLATGARLPYLAERDIVISEVDSKTNQLVTYWDQVFPSLKESNETKQQATAKENGKK